MKRSSDDRGIELGVCMPKILILILVSLDSQAILPASRASDPSHCAVELQIDVSKLDQAVDQSSTLSMEFVTAGFIATREASPLKEVRSWA